MILLIIIVSFIVFITILLLIPIQLRIDSIKGIYQMEWKNLVRANLLFENEEPIARLKIFFWEKDLHLLKTQISSKKVSKERKKKAPKQKKKFDFRKKFNRLMKAIQVNQFFLNIDTDRYIWNAYLYPLFFLLRKEKRDININFQGNVELLLEIQSRPIKILYALLF